MAEFQFQFCLCIGQNISLSKTVSPKIITKTSYNNNNNNNYYYYYLRNDNSTKGAFQCHIKNPPLSQLRIPTGRGHTSWLLELPLESPRTNSFSCPSRGFEPGSSAFKSPTLQTTKPRCLLIFADKLHQTVMRMSRVIIICKQFFVGHEVTLVPMRKKENLH